MQPITTIHPGLYASQLALSNGRAVYLGCEKVDNTNIAFWKGYEAAATQLGVKGLEFCIDLRRNRCPTYPNLHSDYFGLSRDQYSLVTQFFDRKGCLGPSRVNPFEAVEDGLSGMAQVLSVSDRLRDVFIVYASSTPIETDHSVANSKDVIPGNFKDYKDLFGHILMSYVSLTAPGMPTVTHYGIVRNPLDFFDTEERYKKLSMKLHGFGAQVALTKLPKKVYMITTPMESMLEIFAKNMSAGMFVGTNLDLDNPEYQSLQERFPPIYHINPKTKSHRLAVRGTDLKQHVDALSIFHTEFTQPKVLKFDHSGVTINGIKVVILLSELRKYFQCVDVASAALAT